MFAAARAGVSVVMLAGFYVVALVQLCAVIVLAVLLGDAISGLLAIKVTVPLFTATGGAVVLGMWKAFRSKPEPPHGLAVGRDAAPALWAAVDGLAREVRTRVPKEIRLVPEVNAAVVERSRMLGLVGGRRYLYVGLPLVQALTVDQLRWVLAHELGHYSRRHTRFAAIAYRGRLTLAATIDQLGPYNVAGWVFKAYARLYLLVDSAVVRRQEYEADEASVRVAGRDSGMSVLRELPVLNAAWEFFVENYVVPGMESGYVPADLFGGFSQLLAARQDELNELRGQEPESTGSKWDTHPPIADRIAAIAAIAVAPYSADGRPAGVLFPDVAAVGRRMQDSMLDAGDRVALPWPEFTHAMVTAQQQRDADRVFRTIARQTGRTDVGLAEVLDLIAAGNVEDIAEPFFPDAARREAGSRFADVLQALLQLAAIRSGVAGWQHSWAGPAQFVGMDGQPLPLPLDEIAKLAVSPGGLDEARRRLSELGIDTASAAMVEQRASAVGAELFAAMANVKVDGVQHDLLVLNNGFVFVAEPGKADGGQRRLRKLVESAPAAELARRHRFLPYEEITSARVTKEVPAHASLTLHNGREIALQEKWDGEALTKESRDVLLQVVRAIG